MKSIRLDNVSFSYDDKVVFKNFNLELKKGLNFVVGNNGSGKTTFFKIVKQSIPFLGKIYIDDKLLNKKMTNIFFLDLDYINSLNGNVNELVNNNFIDYFDLINYLSLDVKKLDLSIKIKVAFSILLSSDFDAFFIENVLMWLNKNDREKILKKLKTKAKDKIVLLITNNLEDTLVANRVILLNNGKIILDGSLEDFYGNEKPFNDCNLQLPFIVDLSYKLKLYNIIDKVYFNQRKLVDDLWK